MANVGLKWLFFVCLVMVIAPISTQDTGKGIYVSYYRGSYGYLRLYPGTVDTLRNSVSASYKFYDMGRSFVTTLATDVRNKSMYYLDVQYRSVYRLDNINIHMTNNLTLHKLHSGLSRAIGTVVFDWISKNVYWTDRYHNWIAVMPGYTNDTTLSRAIIEDDLNVPVALAIDPINGYLFFSDIKQSSARIEWSDLIGENRATMVSGNSEFIIAIAADINEKNLYLVDYRRQTLEKVAYGSNERHVIKRLNTYQLVDLAIYQSYLCVTEQRYQNAKCYTKSGTEVWTNYIPGTPWGITVFDESLQPTEERSFCLNQNCSHFCVNTPTEAKCVCKEGFDLLEDNSTCNAKHNLTGKGLLITNGTHICTMSIRAVTGGSSNYTCIVSDLNPGISYILSDTINARILYWNDTAPKMLRSYDVLSNTFSDLTSTGNITGLFYDWVSEDLYYSEVSMGIYVVDLVEEDAPVSSIYQTDKVRYLTGNPHQYMLYWITDSGNQTEIIGGNFTGSKTTILSKGLSNPIGLFYDEVRQRLYYIDRRQVMSIKVDGTGPETYQNVGLANRLLIYKDYLIWTEGANTIKAGYLDTSRPERIISHPEIGTLTGICIYDPRLQKKERGPCEEKNGGCQHICIPSTTGPECRCTAGYILASDRKSCTSEPLKNNFAMIVDFTHDRILQVSTEKTSVTAADLVAVPTSQLASPVGILYDNKHGYLYYTELYNKRLRRVKMGSSAADTTRTIRKFPNHYADRMVMDESNGYIYFTAVAYRPTSNTITTSSYIGVLRLDRDPLNPLHKVLISPLNEPRCLAIHPKRGDLFFGEIGTTSSFIYKYNMDGTGSKVLASSSNRRVRTPIGIAVDYTDGGGYVYWADLVADQIKRVDLEGGNYAVFYTDQTDSHPSDLVFKGPYLYFISWNRRKITRLLKSNATEVPWMPDIADLGRLDNLKVFPEEQQPISTLCQTDNGGCSTFCLLTDIAMNRCACEDGVALQDDSRTCSNMCSRKLQNANIQSDCTIYPNATCEYTCDTNFVKNENIQTLTCLQNKSWSVPEETLCKEIKCSLNQKIRNGTLSSTCSGKIGQTCDFTCSKGYFKSNLQPICQSGGVWNNVFDKLCTEIKCNISQILPNGMLSNSCSGGVGETCNYTCNSGYIKNKDALVLQCQPNGTWNGQFNTLCTAESKCNKSQNIPNGKFASSCLGKIGETCDFTCTNGYIKNIPNIQCQSNAVWSSSLNNLCKEIRCNVNRTILHGELSSSCLGKVKETCDFTRSGGYKKNIQNLQCQENGSWNNDLNALCKEIRCNISQRILHGQLSSSCVGKVKEICDFTCTGVYKKNKNIPNIQCREDGSWSNDFNILCEEISCSNILSIPNGRVIGSCPGKLADICNYDCSPGYTKNPDIPVLFCQRNGSWSNEFTNLCKEIRCVTVQTIPNGKLSSSCMGKTGEICSFNCSGGYDKNKDSPSLLCQSTGLWNSSFSNLCKEKIFCGPQLGNATLIDPCTREVGTKCGFKCNAGFEPKQSVLTKVECTAAGKFIPEDICKEYRRCESFIPHGSFTNDCKFLPGSSMCSFICSDDYVSPYPKNTKLECLLNATWTMELQKLCILPEIVKPLTPLPHAPNNGPLIAGVVVALLFVILVLVLIGFFFFYRRRKLAQQAVYKSHPNVQFKANPEERNNPYTVFENPPDIPSEGEIRFTNPLSGVEMDKTIYLEFPDQVEQPVVERQTVDGGIQFANPMSEMDDAYATVSGEKINQSETDDPPAYYLRDVGEKTLTFSPNQKEMSNGSVKDNEINDKKENPYENI